MTSKGLNSGVRRLAGVGGLALAGAVAVASVAWACVPADPYVNTPRFTVTAATPEGDGRYETNDQMIAQGGTPAGVTPAYYVEKANWRYYIKLRQGVYSYATVAQKRDCGDFGTLQTVATSDSTKRFTQPFKLVVGTQSPGPAHFCALPGPQKETGDPQTFPVSMALGGSEMYVRSGPGIGTEQVTIV